jgi:hypothetical protein
MIEREIEREREREREVFKELPHAIVGAGKSEDYRAGWKLLDMS